MRAEKPWIEPSATILMRPSRSRSLLRSRKAAARSTPSAGAPISRSSGTMRVGNSSPAVTRSIMSTAASGSGLARSVAVVTPARTHSREKALNPASSPASTARSMPSTAATCIIASGPFSSPVGKPSLPSGTPGWSMPAAQPADGGQCRAVAVDDVAAGVDHAHRPRGRHAVQVLAHAATVVEVDRVEAPAGQRRGGVGQRGLGVVQSLQHRIERLGAGPGPAVRIAAVEEAAVDEAPERTFHQVAVAFHQPRHQHLGGQPVVQRVGAPARQFFQRTHAEDAAVAHRHVRGERPRRVHRDDLAGREYRGLHGLPWRGVCTVWPGRGRGRTLAR